MNMFRVFLLGAVLGYIFCVSGCDPIPMTWKYQEQQRIVSPDGQVEAVVMTGDAGAVTASTTFVCIVPKGGQVATNQPMDGQTVFRADHIKGLDVKWKEKHLLVIQYDQARISGFNNLWDVLKNRQYAYPVEIRLAPTSPDYSVPAADRESFPVK